MLRPFPCVQQHLLSFQEPHLICVCARDRHWIPFHNLQQGLHPAVTLGVLTGQETCSVSPRKHKNCHCPQPPSYHDVNYCHTYGGLQVTFGCPHPTGLASDLSEHKKDPRLMAREMKRGPWTRVNLVVGGQHLQGTTCSCNGNKQDPGKPGCCWWQEARTGLTVCSASLYKFPSYFGITLIG